jgi:hypothetical protein
MLCHSFELEPLGRRESSKKYEPRFADIAEEELTKALSKRGPQLATSAYEEFLPKLVQRDLQDISETLRVDPGLEARMKQEADSLIGWSDPAMQE